MWIVVDGARLIEFADAWIRRSNLAFDTRVPLGPPTTETTIAMTAATTTAIVAMIWT